MSDTPKVVQPAKLHLKMTRPDEVGLRLDVLGGEPEALLEMLARSVRQYRETGNPADDELAELADLESKIITAFQQAAAGDYKALATSMLFIGFGWGFFEVADGWKHNLAKVLGARKSRKPDIDKWIVKQIKRTPSATCAELYKMAPDYVKDPDRGGVGIHAFRKRYTKLRKK